MATSTIKVNWPIEIAKGRFTSNGASKSIPIVEYGNYLLITCFGAYQVPNSNGNMYLLGKGSGNGYFVKMTSATDQISYAYDGYNLVLTSIANQTRFWLYQLN